MNATRFGMLIVIGLAMHSAYGNDFVPPAALRNCDPPKSKVADSILIFDSDACCTWAGGEMKINMGVNGVDAVPTGTQMVTFVRKVSTEHAQNLRRSQIVLVEGRAYRWNKPSSADFDRSALKRGKYFCSMPAEPVRIFVCEA